MSDFYIVPPRLLTGSFDGNNGVTSFNGLRGDITFTADTTNGLRLNSTGNSFNFSIQPDFYIKKSGDTITGNIRFSPILGNYGVAIGSGISNPSSGVSGALFFNTTDLAIKVHDGTSWGTIPGVGITQAAADVRYLKLDGTNTPTAALSMGSQFLRVANLAPVSAPGLAGQIYFNTSSKRIQVYDGFGWTFAGGGITSISVGIGLSTSQNPIIDIASISVDQTSQLTWTLAQTFTTGLIAGIVTSPLYTSSSTIALRPATNSVAGVMFQNNLSQSVMVIDTLNNRVGIGVTNPAYDLEIAGEISATTKSFLINHPTKPGMKLRYGSLEGPENGVYVRGMLSGKNTIELPEYWTKLVDYDSITVNLTPMSRFAQLYVEKIEDNKVFVSDVAMNPIKCFFVVWAERIDIAKLQVEI